jgi:hypothetical protein
MYAYIPDEEYVMSSKEVVAYLNKHLKKEITSGDVSNWTKNYEINALKSGNSTRWRYREVDLRDFTYRYENNMLHKFNNSYHERTSCRIARDILREFYMEESTFQSVICVLVTLHPYALYNDPNRSYQDIGRAEGGIMFKDAAVHFSTHSVGPKTTALELRKQRLLYPVLVAEAINILSLEYVRTDGANVKDKIMKAGWKLVDRRITEEMYKQEITNIKTFFGGWSGLNFQLHNEIRPMIFVEMPDEEEIV